MLLPRMDMVRISPTRVRGEASVGTAARWNISSAARSALNLEPANIILTRSRRMEIGKVDAEVEEIGEVVRITIPNPPLTQ